MRGPPVGGVLVTIGRWRGEGGGGGRDEDGVGGVCGAQARTWRGDANAMGNETKGIYSYQLPVYELLPSSVSPGAALLLPVVLGVAAAAASVVGTPTPAVATALVVVITTVVVPPAVAADAPPSAQLLLYHDWICTRSLWPHTESHTPFGLL